MPRRPTILIFVLAAILATSCAAGLTVYQKQVQVAQVGFHTYETISDLAADKAATLIKVSRDRKLTDGEVATLKRIKHLRGVLDNYQRVHNTYLKIVEFAHKAQTEEVATRQEKVEAQAMADNATVRLNGLIGQMMSAARNLDLGFFAVEGPRLIEKETKK